VNNSFHSRGIAGDQPASATADDAVRGISRKAFLATGLAVGVGAGLGPLGKGATAFAKKPRSHSHSHRVGRRHGLTKGDIAILTFLAAAEFLEADLWEQYNELAGIQDSELPGGGGCAPYKKALQVLDQDMPQYIHDNADDERSHAAFINAYLESKGAAPVNLDPFRTIPSSTVSGARQIGRLTNLTQLTIDTSWWARYRSSTRNADLGDSFPQAVPGLAKGAFAAIPRSDADLEPAAHLRAIANTAGFHFATIEQGGSSLYPSLAQRVSNPEVLRVLLSIGPTEVMHFQTWQDKAGNAPAVTDPTNGLEFPDLGAPRSTADELQANLIMPEPTAFLDRRFPAVSILRPTNTAAAATGAAGGLAAQGLFKGQSQAFFKAVKQLAAAADAAGRG
jgi:hypothetical protein